jgi:hypothetical protein
MFTYVTTGMTQPSGAGAPVMRSREHSLGDTRRLVNPGAVAYVYFMSTTSDGMFTWRDGAESR